MADAVDAILAQWGRERPDLDVSAMGVVGRISRAQSLLGRELKEFFAARGLESWEFDVLATLRRHGAPYELTAGALLRAAMVTSGAITNRIDRMEAKGLVERVRDTGDRRSVRIRLAPRGLEIVDELVGLHVANEERLLAALSPAERGRLAAALRTLLESLGDTSLGSPPDEG
ncbi:MarR family winged helix-turn-helix transcriptional regulator [Actinomadura mexicana]|uniref:DNA-binding transcriptional regulator, MarR family n=1 Tax=Actinomadura mexicana TaxID=134959 RepID=A0A238Z842_9ACTN|nr:MarR family transcriptional regulator [Actinomadura mexicana]SNR79665.1 DNA-binding transcriptional regulator, MarR family [Actinomadura mexicana]